MNKPASILCAVILLVGATIAEAQQPGKSSASGSWIQPMLPVWRSAGRVPARIE